MHTNKQRHNGLRVVIIDDDESLLDGLERSIHNCRPGWVTKVFSSAADALVYIQNNGDNIDVIICDYEMPFISGSDVFDAVASRFPNIFLVSFSGTINSQDLLSKTKSIDLVLAKPLEASIICSLICDAYSK